MLELKNVSAGYGNENVLCGVTVSFEKGRLTSVIGVNGCGKSTLLKSILGILPLTGGEIAVDGSDLRSLRGNEIAKRIAYLSQGKSTPDMTVGQMVLHGRFPYLSYPRRYGKADRAIAEKAMEDTGVSHLADKPLSELSGGMRQNAYIAMALAQDTDYILLDEPTTYLDIAHQLELMTLLRRLADMGKGVIAVMHDLPLAFDFSDTVTAIRNGAVAAHLAPTEMCASPVIREIFGVGMERMADGKYRYAYEPKR